MRTFIGILLVMVGIGAADSENLLVPLVLIGAGALLLRKVVMKE